MMKKLLPLSAAALAIVLSSQAQAAATAIDKSTNIAPTDCSALSNNITVQLSSDVVAAYNCNGISFVAATCHTAGTKKAQTVDAQYDASTGNPLPEYTNCDASGKCTFNGRVAFRGTSQGGSVGAVPMGDSACDMGTIVNFTPDTMLVTP